MASAPAPSSPSSPPRMLTLARDLRRRKARERGGLFVAEGVRTVEALLASSLPVEGALVSPVLMETPRGLALRAALDVRGIQTAEVSAKDFASACDTDTPQGILAVAAVPEHRWDALGAAAHPHRILLLDGVQDPGNVGTMIRTAAALGATATVAMPGTVDLWNAKVVRSAMGTLFSHMAFASDWDAFDRYRADHLLTIWGTDTSGEALSPSHRISDDLALVLGNEGAGLSASAHSRVDRTVSLPITGVESLNVAVAAGIFLYEIRAS